MRRRRADGVRSLQIPTTLQQPSRLRAETRTARVQVGSSPLPAFRSDLIIRKKSQPRWSRVRPVRPARFRQGGLRRSVVQMSALRCWSEYSPRYANLATSGWLAGALREALLQLEGAFSLVFLAQDRIIVARDPHGFRPLAVGEMEISGGRKCYVFASETCAFDLIGAVYLHDVDPGEMVIAGPDGITRERWAPEQDRAQCVFEHVYFARPDSMVFGRSVEESREAMGRLLAREHPADADLVVPVPDSGVAAAIGYADGSGLPFRHALIRNHYVGRTFIEPSQAIRDFGVKLKLNPIRHLLQGRRVVLVDDSIVRGTTSRKIVRMVRQAGAREVHLRIS